MTRRNLIHLATAATAIEGVSQLNGQSGSSEALPGSSETLQSELRRNAGRLRLPGFVAGVVREGKLSVVQAEGSADVESSTPMRKDHIFFIASLTKTFTAVMMMQFVEENKVSLDDYVLDYPFLSLGFTPDRLVDPNVKLKHALSHTSEGRPGDQFVYSGGRYNFAYGVFEKLSGNTTKYLAVAHEFRKRIEQPLGLTSTLAGYPADKSDSRVARIASHYLLDKKHLSATKDRGVSGATTLYPGTGMLSSLDDLAAYTNALDQNVLLSREGYARLTTPFALNDGRRSPYGLGWSTQQVAGNPVHWHYGYSDSYSSLLVRIPEKKTSFIFLSNTGAASAPFLLGYGNLLTSPFVVAFLDSALPGALSANDRDYSQAFLLRYTEAEFGRDSGEAKAILKKLRAKAPARFRVSDRALISLLSDLSDPEFAAEMDSLSDAYRESGDFHPDTSLAIARYYEETVKQPARRDTFLHHVADRTGYESGSTRDACVKLGSGLLKAGKADEGRRYLWKAAQAAKNSGASLEAQESIVRMLKP